MPEEKGLIIGNQKRYPVIGYDGLHYFNTELEANQYLIKMENESEFKSYEYFSKYKKKYDLKYRLFLAVIIFVLALILYLMIFE